MSYNDSRNAAIKLYRQLRLGWIFNTSTFTGNLVLALIITYFFSGLGYGNDVNFVFFITSLAIGLWMTESLPPFAVGIFIIACLLVGFGTDFILPEYRTPVEVYLGTWTSSVIWLLLGGFFLAEAMSIVELDTYLFRITVKRFGAHPEKLLLGLMFTTAVGSMVMSNTATTAMMVSSILPLARYMGKNSNYTKALLVGIPAAATFGGMGTIIGSTPNAIAVGALQDKGLQISFVDWMLFGMPTGLIAVYIFWYFLKRKISGHQYDIHLDQFLESKSETSPTQRRMVLATLFVTVSMWLTEPLHGIPVAATSAIPIVLLTLFQIIQAEHVRRLPWDTLMLVAGGLALGIAMVQVGLTNIAMDYLMRLPVPMLVVAILFSLFAVLLSNVMSNTAAASILVPIGMSLPGIYAFTVPLVVALSCSSAVLLPVSTPANAVAYSTGMVEQKYFRQGGVLMIIVGPILAMISAVIWGLLFIGLKAEF
jgi:sodium-dependent dicarboxylate transporter 2/3/5